MTESLVLTDEVLQWLRKSWSEGVTDSHIKPFEPASVAHVLSTYFAVPELKAIKESMLVVGYGKGDTEHRYEKYVGNFHAIWSGLVLFRHEYFSARPMCSGMLVSKASVEPQDNHTFFELKPFGNNTNSSVSIAEPVLRRMEHRSPYGDAPAVLNWYGGPHREGSVGIVAHRWSLQKAWLDKWLPNPG
jgi:hypothetical protein